MTLCTCGSQLRHLTPLRVGLPLGFFFPQAATKIMGKKKKAGAGLGCAGTV